MSMKARDKSRQRRQQCKLAQKECKVGAVYKAQPTLFFVFAYHEKWTNKAITKRTGNISGVFDTIVYNNCNVDW